MKGQMGVLSQDALYDVVFSFDIDVVGVNLNDRFIGLYSTVDNLPETSNAYISAEKIIDGEIVIFDKGNYYRGISSTYDLVAGTYNSNYILFTTKPNSIYLYYDWGSDTHSRYNLNSFSFRKPIYECTNFYLNWVNSNTPISSTRCKIESLNLNYLPNLLYIGAHSCPSLSELTIDSCQSLLYLDLQNIAITSLTIPQGATGRSYVNLSNCKSLVDVLVSAPTIYEEDRFVFNNCDNLNSITFSNNEIENLYFSYVNSNNLTNMSFETSPTKVRRFTLNNPKITDLSFLYNWTFSEKSINGEVEFVISGIRQEEFDMGSMNFVNDISSDLRINIIGSSFLNTITFPDISQFQFNNYSIGYYYSNTKLTNLYNEDYLKYHTNISFSGNGSGTYGIQHLTFSDSSTNTEISSSGMANLVSLYVDNCPSLTKLDCYSNSKLSTLDFGTTYSGIKNLISYNCTTLSNLDISNLTSLVTLNSYGCSNLTSVTLGNLDNLKFVDLRDLNATGNKLPEIDFSDCNYISEINLNYCVSLATFSLGVQNCLTTLSMYGCNSVTSGGTLYIQNIPTLKYFNLTGLNDVEYLDFNGTNNIENLQLFNYNNLLDLEYSGTSLSTINYYGNSLLSIPSLSSNVISDYQVSYINLPSDNLDLTVQTELDYLYIQYSSLNTVEIPATINNTLLLFNSTFSDTITISNSYVNQINNPSFNGTLSILNSIITNIDKTTIALSNTLTTSYIINTSTIAYFGVNDTYKKSFINDINVDSSTITTFSIGGVYSPEVQSINLSDSYINLLSLQYVTTLTDLDLSTCTINQISILDCPSMSSITIDNKTITNNSFSVSGCNISSLDISGITSSSLISIDISDNKLTSVTLSNNIFSTYSLYINDNQLTNLNLPTSTYFNHIYYDTNSISTLDVSVTPSLSTVSGRYNQFDTNNAITMLQQLFDNGLNNGNVDLRDNLINTGDSNFLTKVSQLTSIGWTVLY